MAASLIDLSPSPSSSGLVRHPPIDSTQESCWTPTKKKVALFALALFASGIFIALAIHYTLPVWAIILVPTAIVALCVWKAMGMVEKEVNDKGVVDKTLENFNKLPLHSRLRVLATLTSNAANLNTPLVQKTDNESLFESHFAMCCLPHKASRMRPALQKMRANVITSVNVTLQHQRAPTTLDAGLVNFFQLPIESQENVLDQILNNTKTTSLIPGGTALGWNDIQSLAQDLFPQISNDANEQADMATIAQLIQNGVIVAPQRTTGK